MKPIKLLTVTNSYSLSDVTQGGLCRGVFNHMQYILTALLMDGRESRERLNTGANEWRVHLTCCQVGSFQSTAPSGSNSIGRFKGPFFKVSSTGSEFIKRKLKFCSTSTEIIFRLLELISAIISHSEIKFSTWQIGYKVYLQAWWGNYG